MSINIFYVEMKCEIQLRVFGDNLKGIWDSDGDQVWGKNWRKGNQTITAKKNYKSYGEHEDDSVPTLKQTLLSDSGALQHSGSHSSSIQGCCLCWQYL